MAFTAYATSEDLAVWLAAAAPANADSLLRAATFLVAKASNRDPYTDVPSESDAPILSDATCAQAQCWITLGVDPAASGLNAKVATEKKLATADIKYETLSADAMREALTCLCVPSETILYAGGLLWLPVPLGDVEPFLFDYGLVGRGCWPWVCEL